MLRNILKATALIIILAMLAFCGSDNQAQDKVKTDVQQTQAKTDATNIDDVLNFAIYDTKGTLRNSSEWIGKKPVVINFWGTWCPPCRMEIPDLVKLYDEYRDQDVEIIGIALRDQAQQVEQFADQNGMKWVMLIGDIDLAKKFEISSVPTTYFIDRTGKIMQVFDPAFNQKTDYFRGAKTYETFKTAFEEVVKL